MKKLIILYCLAIFLSSSTLSAQWLATGKPNPLRSASATEAFCEDVFGNLYADSGMDSTGSMSVSKWDGKTWQQLGNMNQSPTDTTLTNERSSVYTLCTDSSGNIYAAGNLKNVQGKRIVMKWDGKNWQELGAPNGLAANDFIMSICCDSKGNLYAAGFFTNTHNENYIAKWDGTKWSDIGGFNNFPFTSQIYALYVDKNDNLYAGGFIYNGQDASYYIAKWDGKEWSELGDITTFPFNGYIGDITGDELGNIYAAGGFFHKGQKRYVAKWDGKAWAELGDLSVNNNIVCLSSDTKNNVYALGNFTNADKKQYIAKWDGLKWSEFDGENLLTGKDTNEYIFNVLCSKKGTVYATGSFKDSLGYYNVAEYHKKTTAIQSVEKNLFSSITPNPCRTSISITSHSSNNKTVMIYDLSGRLIIHEQLSARNSKDIDVSMLNTGMYIVEFKDEQGAIQREKLIKD